MSRFEKLPLTIKMTVVALPLALVGVLASILTISTYKNHHPMVIASVVSQSNPAFVLGDTTTYPPPGETMPSTCPAPYTGTPPNCQTPTTPTNTGPGSSTYAPPSTTTSGSPPTYQNTPYSAPPAQTPTNPTNTSPSGSSTPTQPSNNNSYQQPTSCPAPYTGTPPNCVPPAGYNQPNGNGNYQPGGSQPNGSPPQMASPTFTVNNPNSCISSVLGADAAARFQSGSFSPTPEQIAKAQSCFSAQVNFGPPPTSGQNSQGPNGTSNFQGGSQPFANIPIAPPAAFQADSPMLACARSIMGDRFGNPTPELADQVQSKCFAAATSGQQIGFIDPSGQNHGGPLPGIALASAGPNGQPGNEPQIPAEVKACIIKAGLSDNDINAISHGQAPTAAQQSAGEGCFKQYAKDKGLTAPTLTPPDPSQPFDPNSKQNQCADLVAQTHGIRFNQINPGIVASWSADDIGKLRSCYGVAPASSADTGGMPFAPTSPEVTVSSSKLTCIQTALGASKLAAVMAGTSTISDSERKAVYDKCINPTKLVGGSNPALLGILAAMPPSDIESQFIPVDSQILPTPTASDANTNANGEVTVGGEVDVKEGETLPTKVDVFVKSTPQIFTVSLKKISATKASWSVNMAQNKLPKGNHEAYAVTTLADATQLRSPTAKFAIATAKKIKSHLPIVIEGTVVGLAVLYGGWAGWRWHNKKSMVPWRRKHVTV